MKGRMKAGFAETVQRSFTASQAVTRFTIV
jgi:hypothetical protein